MTRNRIYLDNAATSWPKPETVYAAVDDYQRRLGAPAGLLPNLETLTFRLYPSLEEAHLALRRGEVKALAYDLTGHEPLTLPTDHRRVRAPLADYTVLTFNLRRPPFDELALRQALSYAIDPQAVIDEALDGQALPLLTPILPSSWAYARDLTPYRDNPEHIRATQLRRCHRHRFNTLTARIDRLRKLQGYDVSRRGLFASDRHGAIFVMSGEAGAGKNASQRCRRGQRAGDAARDRAAALGGVAARRRG